MRKTQVGTDYIVINEENLNDEQLRDIERIHLIRLDFDTPTVEKVEQVLNDFSETNRYIIDRHIRFYNDILKRTNKKYYVSNKKGDRLISFYKRNNKVLLDTTKLTVTEKSFVFNVLLEDILNNTEVVITDIKHYKHNLQEFDKWNGNLILV